MKVLRASRSSVVRAFVACEVGNSFYALPVDDVQEIIQPLILTELPHAPPGVIGAVEHRERIVPVLDLGERLGYGRTEDARRKWVLVKGRGNSVGIVVTQVHEVFEVLQSSLRAAPEVGDSVARAAKYVLTYREKMAFVLSLESVAALADLSLKEGEDG